MAKIKYIIFLFLLINTIGCNLFSTRNPQEPEDSSTDFQPASTHYILFSNFNNSFIRMNVEYYSDCFLEDIQSSVVQYNFSPDADALARYGVLFSNWNRDSEKQFLQGLRSSMPTGATPILIWKSKKYDIITSDSAVFVGEYNIQIKQQNYDNNYSGISRLVFARKSNGLWYIKNWSDFRSLSDTLPSWSILKARFAL